MTLEPAVINRISEALNLALEMPLMGTVRQRDEAWRYIRDARDDVRKIVEQEQTR